MALQNVEVEAGRRVERVEEFLRAEVGRVASWKILEKFETEVGSSHGRIRGRLGWLWGLLLG